MGKIIITGESDFLTEEDYTDLLEILEALQDKVNKKIMILDLNSHMESDLVLPALIKKVQKITENNK